VCGTKNFSSVRLYSAPQSHWTIAVIVRICAYGRPVQAGFVGNNQRLAPYFANESKPFRRLTT
jgi:hypothetical protein